MFDLFLQRDWDSLFESKKYPEALSFEPLIGVDAWLASSLLQKAIRRGDALLARRAAFTLYRWRSNAIWHRFMVIAFEDVGIASVDALIAVVLAGFDRQWRGKYGSDIEVVGLLAELLAKTPKDRSPDHLICTAHSHPEYENVRELVGSSDAQYRLNMALDSSLPLADRAIAAWYCSGIEWGEEHCIGSSNLCSLLEHFMNKNVPSDLIEATRWAAKRTNQSICIMAPLIWLKAGEGCKPPIIQNEILESQNFLDLPLYAFDKHTRVGKAAISRFSKENEIVRSCLAHLVPEYKALDVALMAAFHTDASLVASRFIWEGALALEALGEEADLMSVGVSQKDVQVVLSIFRGQVAHLNEIRAELFKRQSNVQK